MVNNTTRSFAALPDHAAMKLNRALAISALLLVGIGGSLTGRADMADIQVYKGELRIMIPDKQTRDRLAIRYRSKTQEVTRIALGDVKLTNTQTRRTISLPDRSASLENRIDQAGYWNIDTHYDDLNLGQQAYRIEGRLTLYLIGAQRTSDFSAYLQPRPMSKPEDSSIDWGSSD